MAAVAPQEPALLLDRTFRQRVPQPDPAVEAGRGGGADGGLEALLAKLRDAFYENALLAIDELGPRLDAAIIAVVPAVNGVARYVYDYDKLLHIYAEFREVALYGDEDENSPEDGDEVAARRNAERIEGIHETILNIAWGNPSGGMEPLLVTDPEIEPLGLDCKDEETTVLIIGGKKFWVVA